MARTELVHLAVRQRHSVDSILLPERASWLWESLMRLFPDALAGFLMRDHFHVLASTAAVTPRRVAGLIGTYARRFGFGPGHWRPVDAPVPIRHRKMLALTIRYIVLNGCRDRMALDPLECVYSTHRDVMGATAKPWVEAERVAEALGQPIHGFRDRHHAFVSGDPHVSVTGTPPPRPAPRREVPSVPLEQVAVAAAIAFREPTEAIRRRGPVRATFVVLALEQGWRDRRALIDATGASAATLSRLARSRVDPAFLAAARLCLGDARLRCVGRNRN